MNDIDLIKNLLEKPIAFHRAFFHVTQDVKAALFLSQLYYWSKTKDFDWFYKVREEWEEETGLSFYEQKRARKILIKLGLIEEKRIGVPGVINFKFVFEKFIELSKNFYSHKERNSLCEANGVDTHKGNFPQSEKLHLCKVRNFTCNTENTFTENTNTTIADTVSPTLVLDLYHDELKALPKVKVFTEKRKRQVKATIKNYPKAKDPDWWRRYFQKANEIPFLHGENDRKWCADFDFLTKFDNIVKVIEGKYEK